MKSLRIFGFIALVCLLNSCEKILMDAKPKTDALSIFDEYATLVKEKYAMLEFKRVDIDALADSIRNTIQTDISEEDLFNKLAIITRRLRDGHSILIQNINAQNTLRAGFDILEGYPSGANSGILMNHYISTSVNPNIKYLKNGEGNVRTVCDVHFCNIRAVWGVLVQNNQIGYLWIPSWDVGITDGEIEQIFKDLKDTKGLIFDQRLNGGGDPFLATTFASYFTNKPIDIGFERFKTGPGANDFSDSQITLQPASSGNKYLKEVRVLTDRNVYSASTTFLYSVDPIKTIKTMGQRSGGGSGSVADGYLANGWYWGLSTSEFIDTKGRHLDDGVDPDIAVALDLNDKTKDEVVEAAILDLQ